MDYSSCFKEITEILTKENKYDVQCTCVHQLLGLTGSKEASNLLLDQHDLLDILTSFVVNKKEISRIACLILINLSAEELGPKKILHIDCSGCNKVRDQYNIISHSLDHILNRESDLADSCCMLLCNLSRTVLHSTYIVEHINDSEATINKLIDAFCDLNYNKKECNLNYLGPFFSNISQCNSAMEYLYKSAERLLPFTDYKSSIIRRGGIVGMFRNFSFKQEKHSWLLSPEGCNILPGLLLPLAGPEEFPEDEMEKLPIDLQYLPETKKRDSDPDIRRMLLETLLQLCSSKEGRTVLRDQNAYVILRELHKNEEDRQVLLACENVVDILIRTEDEIGRDKLNDIEVPTDLQKKFEEMDMKFVQES